MDALTKRLTQRLWPATEPRGRAARRLLLVARHAFALGRDLAAGELSMRAMGLVYTTMLAIVPTLGFAFALAKGLGILSNLEDWLAPALEPIGEDASSEVTANIRGFVDNVNGPVLGVVSVGLLLLTVISMAQKVEGSFNFVWRVDRPRSFARRFTEYLSVILIGPTVMLATAALIASLSNAAVVEELRSLPVLGLLIAAVGDALPYLMTIAAFTGLYLFIPNARVRLRPAATGAFAAGVTWAASGYLFTGLVVASARFEALYSGFAIVLILMLWLYLSWLILLLGSQLAFYLQHPFHLRHGTRVEPIDNDARERLCLSVMYLIASDYAEPSHGWTHESLAAALRVPREALEPIMAALANAGLVVRASGERLIPGRDPHRIRLTDILDAVRGRGRDWVELRESWNGSVDAIVDRIDEAIETELGGRTLGQLVDETLAARGPD